MNGRFYGARITGVQRFAREVVARLSALEDITLFVPGNVTGDAGLPESAHVVRGRLSGRLWEQLELPLAAGAVDVVLHPANAAPIAGPRGVVVVHDLLPLSNPSGFRPFYRAWVRMAHAEGARRSRAVITVSRWSAGEISRTLGLPPGRVTVVSQGPGPLDAPAPAPAVARIRERYGLSRSFFVCVTGGDPRKGLDFLRDVWRCPAGPLDADLVAVGGRSAAIHREGEGARDAAIRHVGHVPDEDLRALYTGSVALLFPSLAEGFGRPPLEALACATRVVAAPYGAVREVLGDAGEVVPLETEAWAEAVRALLAEPAGVRAARLDEGRRWAGTFSWERAAGEVARVCREAAGSPP